MCHPVLEAMSYFLVTTGQYTSELREAPKSPGPCLFAAKAIDVAPADYLKKLIEEEETLRRNFPERRTAIEWVLVSWTPITKEQFEWFVAHGCGERI